MTSAHGDFRSKDVGRCHRPSAILSRHTRADDIGSRRFYDQTAEPMISALGGERVNQMMLS
ncbi:hypothetical protein J6590_048984 [Homalodisca vitripennis]|nr:hypothetical protein J6590_048984 [Homalodisca vitripennis]